MKRLSQALLAFALAAGIHAEVQGMSSNSTWLSKVNEKTDPNQCLDLNGLLQTHTPSEVVVWVNEDGDTIRTETSLLPAATELQSNVSDMKHQGRIRQKHC